MVPFNAENGDGLNSLSYESDEISFMSNSKPGFPKVGVSFLGGSDGMKLEFAGVATRPVEVTIKSEGFEDTAVTLDENSDDELRVAMSPLAGAEREE